MRTRQIPADDIEEGHLSTLLCHDGNIAHPCRWTLGIDPETQGFVDDPEANRLLKGTYREAYVVPEKV